MAKPWTQHGVQRRPRSQPPLEAKLLTQPLPTMIHPEDPQSTLELSHFAEIFFSISGAPV